MQNISLKATFGHNMLRVRTHQLLLTIALWAFAAATLHAQPKDEPTALLQRAYATEGRERHALLSEYLQSHALGDLTHKRVLDEVSAWARTHGDTSERVEALLQTASYMNKVGDYRQSLEVTHHILNRAQTTAQQRFHALFIQRATYTALGLYDKAIAIHTALDWNNAHGTWEKIIPDNFLAFTYYKLGEHEKGIETLRKCLRTMDENGNPYWQMSFTNSMGVMYEKLGQLDSAWHYYQMAKSMLLTNFKPGVDLDLGYYQFTLGLFNGNIAQVLAARGEHLKAIPLYKQDITSSIQEPMTMEYRRNAVNSLVKLAVSYSATGQFENANNALEQARSLLHSYTLPDEESEYLETMSKVYEAQGLQNAALIYAKRYIAFKDSLHKATGAQRTQNLQIVYESGKKERELQAKGLELENLKAQASSKAFTEYVTFFIVVLLASVVIILYLAYRSRLRQQSELAKKTAQIEEQWDLIAKSLNEKDVLLREIHHRVKNNLQIISGLFFLQSKKVTDENARNIIQECQSRVHVMSLIHQKLYQGNNLKTIDLHSYISDLARQIIQTNRKADLQIDLTIEGKGTEQGVEKAVPIGMIVNELVTNSISHAFVGRKMGSISIGLSKRGNAIRLEYTDDGRGIESLANLEKQDSLGMKLVRLLSSQINAAIEFETHAGFKISIEFEAA